MGALALAGLIAAIVGAGVKMYATDVANRAAQKRLQEGAIQQRLAQDRINHKNAEATSQYQTNNLEQLQLDEANRISSEIKQNVAESQAIRETQQATAGNTSQDYQQAQEDSQNKVERDMNAFADLLGRIRSVGTMRQQEGWNTNRRLQDIQMIGRNARGDWSVAQTRANDALHSKDGLANFGTLLSAAGTAMSLGSAASAMAGSGAASGASAGSSAGAAGASGAVDAVSSAAPSVAGNLFNKAGLWWSALSPASKAGLIFTGSALASAGLSNPWRK